MKTWIADPTVIPADAAEDALAISVSDSFIEILATQKLSLAVTIVPDGLLLIGLSSDGNLAVDHRAIPHAWGIAVNGDRLAVATHREIIVYANSPLLAPLHPEHPKRHDAFFSPRVTFFTGDSMIHDMAIGQRGIVVANTRFSAVCMIDGRYNFDPIWHPSFISRVIPEDCCHLNGLAVADGQLRYVTAFGSFDQPAEWRKHSPFHGVLIDVERDRMLCEGLCLPHSPRLFDNRLFVLESGYGTVLEIDRASGEKSCLAQLPGLTRGLCAHADILFVGLSPPRDSVNRWTLPIHEVSTPLVAGVVAVDRKNGAVIGMLQVISRSAREIFDIQLLSGITCPGFADTSTNPGGLYILDSPSGGYWMKSLVAGGRR
ncbi:TIGR03032 family protein [Candidatus Methylospira mobilis]|uniref:TIGR03032 family protein n=1 Tax=Candidatus Methylospira mobilis TaxID=1808979 RepID=UPI0018856F4B|nr:TIGR03032 family protein [Candidatus Methylospira mobilis]WNV04195.1 TIGR03032 family protein [Candidatus Methylospira mobilis]